MAYLTAGLTGANGFHAFYVTLITTKHLCAIVNVTHFLEHIDILLEKVLSKRPLNVWFSSHYLAMDANRDVTVIPQMRHDM